jgi:putative ABC transport system permease protein
MMKILGTVRGILVSILVLMASLGVWNTMMMSVLERTAEIGVLRAMGMTRLQTMAMFVGEAITIAVLGGLLGAFLGSMGGLAIEHWGIEIGEKITSSMGADTPIKSHVYGDLRLRHVVQSFGLGMLMAFLGSFTPALRAAFVQPVTAMRTGR